MQPGYVCVVDAVERAAEVVGRVRPEQAAWATPCAEWDVEQLRRHLVHVVTALELAGRGEAVPDEHWSATVAAEFVAAAEPAGSAWSDAAAWQRTVRLGAMEVPGPVAAAMLASDLVIHGWDLARAIGVPYSCAEATVEFARQFLVEAGEQGRAMGIYAEVVPVGAEAGPLDQVLALSGRDPQWTATVRTGG